MVVLKTNIQTKQQQSINRIMAVLVVFSYFLPFSRNFFYYPIVDLIYDFATKWMFYHLMTKYSIVANASFELKISSRVEFEFWRKT